MKKYYLTTLLIFSLVFASVYTSVGQCVLEFKTGADSDIYVSDCENNGKVTADWQEPTVVASKDCMNFRLSQTKGPKRNMDVSNAHYNVKYKAMAIDKVSGKLVSVEQAFNFHAGINISPPEITGIPKVVNINTEDSPFSDQNYAAMAIVTDDCSSKENIKVWQLPEVIVPGRTKSVIVFAEDEDMNMSKFEIEIKYSSIK